MDLIYKISILTLYFLFCASLEIDFGTINVAQIRHLLLTGTSCSDVIDKFLERIEKYEKGPLQLNALVTVNSNAKEEAAELDKHLQRTASFMGTLHCVPIVVGDNIDVAHMPTTAGLKALLHSLAPRDADVVQLLKNQGAIVVAKGNVSPFAWEHRYVESQTGGLTKNAYCTSCTPYGASAGAAQAIAVVYGLIGLGTDSGGSIALPAAASSTLGFRPPWNLVSTRGVVPVHGFMDVVGPFTRYADDLAIVMDILDPSKHQRGFYDRLTHNTDQKLEGLRVGVVADAIYDKAVWPVHIAAQRSSLITFHLNEQMKNLIDKSINDMKSLGAEIRNVTMQVQRVLPYLSAFGEFDIASCSSSWLNSYLNRLTSPAPYHSLNQLLRSKTLPESFQRFFETAQRKSMIHQCDTSAETFHRARVGLREQIMQPLFTDNDVILFPMTPDFPFRIHDRRDHPLMGVQLAALAGYPSLTLPVGFGNPVHNLHKDPQAPMGLPASILLVSMPDRMDSLIKLAVAYQKTYGTIVLPESVSGSDGLRNRSFIWVCVATMLFYLSVNPY